MTPVGDLEFGEVLTTLVEPALDGLAGDLAQVGGLGAGERSVLCDGARVMLYGVVHAKVRRVLLVELNAARVTGRLTAPDSAARWDEFLSEAATSRFWASLAEPYPALRPRLAALTGNRCAGLLAAARRLAADRDRLADLLGGAAPGELTAVSLGAGDSHRGGHSVMVLDFDAGRVVYKPRSLATDVALSGLLNTVFADVPREERIRVPRVVARDDYGWAQHVEHVYCEDAAQERTFYRGLGHWAAIMRLLGGTDLHSENVIACGPVPVVVDCETVFTPVAESKPSGFGLAFDQAAGQLARSVLRTGLLPQRGTALGMRGVDVSAAGFLPGRQPPAMVPAIVDAGLDTARLGAVAVERRDPQCHPRPHPDPAASWEHVLDGFDAATATLRGLDQDGRLEGLLSDFADCPIRIVPRPSETYAELSRMLWHPVSLHDEAATVERAAAVLAEMADTFALAPSDPGVIAGEIADLLLGDIPYFAMTPQATEAVQRWRGSDDDFERRVLSLSLVGADLNDGWSPGPVAASPRPGGQDQHPANCGPKAIDPQAFDRRRRAAAADIVKALIRDAIRGEDGTVTWIVSVPQDPSGWAVQPLNLDLYAGHSGLALLLAGYLRETAMGRADPVDGATELLDASVRTLRIGEDRRAALAQRTDTRRRPPALGGFAGLGSRLWSWLALRRVAPSLVPDALDRARALAALVPDALAVAENCELLLGTAGALVPLLHLAAETGDDGWLDLARTVGHRLVETAHLEDGAASWPTPRRPQGLGGLAHGATGIGWSLARLSLATDDPAFAEPARAAFAFEDRLYDPETAAWRDLRNPDHPPAAAWCTGSTGIGLAATDLAAHGWPDTHATIPRAISTTRRHGLGRNHTLCHGDLGSWELLTATPNNISGGEDTNANTALAAQIITSIERNGPTTGHLYATPDPGLLAGTAGIAYQLLRMHPDSALPSVLTLAL